MNLTWSPHLEIARGTFNASCSYAGPPPDANVVAFYEEMEAIRDEEERYEPGSELVFRCVDIGKFVEIGQSLSQEVSPFVYKSKIRVKTKKTNGICIT